MIFPPELKPGDTVAIVAPSSPVPRERAKKCVSLVEKMGFTAKPGISVFSEHNGYSAGTAQIRADDINMMFADKQVRAIWCIRGGDTSAQIMEALDYDLIAQNPKIFVGFSDITNLHVMLNKRCGLITFHGPMVSSTMLEKYDDFTWLSFMKALSGKDGFILENPDGADFEVIKGGKSACGKLTGGNLSVLCSMIGTKYAVDTKGAILFIEDTGEEVRILDRLMHQLKYSGVLDDAKGIIIGDFSNCNNFEKPEYGVNQLMKDIFSDYRKPVIGNIRAGHCTPMVTLPMGMLCEVDTNKCTIKFQGAGK